ncbi:hypothetical protein SVAN01_08951 [Stagonosporopsis vannaccii]|nr:hypothetical protein SVAN01_08951 [Stagonosporopsis vannaccii]
MARVIQDSDDELDNELVPEEHQAGRHASHNHSTGNTSSTEALRRQIEAAHRAHLQSQSLVHDGQTLTSVEVNNNKENASARTETKIIANEYFRTPFLTDQAVLTDILESWPPSQQQNHGLIGHIPQSTETTTGVEWVLDGTIRDAYAQHDPNIMFPKPSSTVPKGKCSRPKYTSEDDVADLDIPKEQYKPRPSRSRSLKFGPAEAIDYSVRPEKATKGEKRAKSTPTTASLADSLSTPNRIRQICDIGFTPSTNAKMLQKNNGDVTQTVDWLITNRVGDDELVPQTSQMSEVTRNRPTSFIDTPVHDDGFQESDFDVKQMGATDIDAVPELIEPHLTTAGTNIATSVEVKTPSTVQVIIPAKSPAPTGEQAQKGFKRRKTALDQPQPMSPVDAVKSAKVEKKRGRGRPRKATKDPASTAPMQEGKDEGLKGQIKVCELSSATNMHPTVQRQEEDLETNTNRTNSGHGFRSLESGDTAIARGRTPEPAFLPDRPEVEPITPERVKKAAPREQLPSNRGKMGYRVGLSKRARIAPLLRTMKK